MHTHAHAHAHVHICPCIFPVDVDKSAKILIINYLRVHTVHKIVDKIMQNCTLCAKLHNMCANLHKAICKFAYFIICKIAYCVQKCTLYANLHS